MSRSAADATRFTATGPSVNSKNSSSATPYRMPSGMKSSPSDAANSKSTLKSTTNPPNGAGAAGKGRPVETPQEKVARLRAQARAARLARETSLIDRVIERGRKIANGAHRATVYTLIGASGMFLPLQLSSLSPVGFHRDCIQTIWKRNIPMAFFLVQCIVWLFTDHDDSQSRYLRCSNSLLRHIPNPIQPSTKNALA